MTTSTNPTPVRTTLAAAVLAAVAGTDLAAQCQGDLLYTTKVTEESNQCAAGVSSLNEVDSSSLQLTQPRASAPFRSASYMPLLGFDALLGDGDADGDFHEPMLFSAIDATVVPRRRGGLRIGIDKTRVFFSTKDSTSDTYGNAMGPGDIARIIRGGRIEHFISAAMIKNAFGIPASRPLDVDAAALGFRPGAAFPDLYLSFEDDHTLNIPPFGAIMMEDGAVLRIPAGAMAFGASPYDGAITVTGTAANSGQICAAEPDMDVVTGNAGAANASGAPVMLAADIDGLTIDPSGGTFQSQWTPAPMQHFWYCAELHTGAGVLSTVGGGSIAVLNGVPLASPVMTTGQQVGLVTPTGVSSLAGLSLTGCGTSHFSLDTPTPVITSPGTLDLDVGGCTGPAAVITVGLGCNVPGCVDLGAPVANPDFPELMTTTVFFIQPTGPDGCGRLSLFLPAPIVGTLAGQTLLFQALDPTTGGHISNPVKISF